MSYHYSINHQRKACPYSSLVHRLTEENNSPTGSCCKNAAACCILHTLCNFYQIESNPTVPQVVCSLWMHFNGNLILLYFIEMLPCTVSIMLWCSFFLSNLNSGEGVPYASATTSIIFLLYLLWKFLNEIFHSNSFIFYKYFDMLVIIFTTSFSTTKK